MEFFSGGRLAIVRSGEAMLVQESINVGSSTYPKNLPGDEFMTQAKPPRRGVGLTRRAECKKTVDK